MLQRRLSRKKKRSRNYEKARIKVAKHHNHIANTRSLFHYKTAHHLCDQAGMIFVEDIDFRIMGKGILGKHTLDAGFGALRDILKQVCFKRDVYFATVDHKGTSQTCPKCRAPTGKKELSQRVHKCIECDYQTHRDHAASEVIRLRGLEQLSCWFSEVPSENQQLSSQGLWRIFHSLLQSVCRGLVKAKLGQRRNLPLLKVEEQPGMSQRELGSPR